MRWYLVDGYNYLHRAGLARGPLEHQRRLLVKRLRGLVRGDGDRVALVWDAHRAYGGFSVLDGEQHGAAMRSVYARESADARILAIVRSAEQPGRYVVVSDDREVAGRARLLGARTASVEEIERRLRRRAPAGGAGSERRRAGSGAHAPEADEKPRTQSAEEIAYWKRVFGADP